MPAQVVSLLRRVLPEMAPAALAELQGPDCRLPETEYRVGGGDDDTQPEQDPDRSVLPDIPAVLPYNHSYQAGSLALVNVEQPWSVVPPYSRYFWLYK